MSTMQPLLTATVCLVYSCRRYRFQQADPAIIITGYAIAGSSELCPRLAR